MALRIRPPSNDVAAPAEWIPSSDPAWDDERINAEKKLLGERELEHPVAVYYSGNTRYDLNAQITIPEPIRKPDGPATATVAAWLRDEPTVFTLRSVGALDWEIAMRNEDRMWYEFCRRGIEDVRNIDGIDGKIVKSLPVDGDGKTSVAWLDALSRANRQTIHQLGLAIFRFCLRREAGGEGKL